MANSGVKFNKGVLYIAIAMIICLFCVLLLAACNNNSSDDKATEREYAAYLRYEYPEDGNEFYAIVTLSGEEKNQLKSKINWHSETFPKDVWYNQQNVAITIDSAAICKEVAGIVRDKDYIHDGKEYNSLKVIFRYDTIYKSITTNSDEVFKSGRYYVHRFVLNEENNSQICNLYLTSQNAASWYSMLIACVIVLAVILLGVALAIKGKLWQKKEKKNE